MGQEEGPLTPTEIESSLEYDSEGETSTSSTLPLYISSPSVVATTRWNGTCSLLISAKLSVGYLVVGITRELNKELSLYCSSIYTNTLWSMLQQY